MKTLINVYAAVIGKIKFLKDHTLTNWLADVERAHPSLNYFIKKTIITDNLYGVDIMEEAVEIAKLRLFLALVAAAENADQLEPLPNIDFNILAGNSLVGLMRVDSQDFEKHHGQRHPTHRRPGAPVPQGLARTGQPVPQELREMLGGKKPPDRQLPSRLGLRRRPDRPARQHSGEEERGLETLDEILLEEFEQLGIKFEQATWDAAKNEPGKPAEASPDASQTSKRPASVSLGFRVRRDPAQARRLRRHHHQSALGGLQAQRQGVLRGSLRAGHQEEDDHPGLREGAGQAPEGPGNPSGVARVPQQFPHVTAYFRHSPQYRNQISIVNGKKAGTDINLYKLFVEQCYNLLRARRPLRHHHPRQHLYDLGSKQLREVLFSSVPDR